MIKNKKKKAKSVRLPFHISPINYKLEIFPDLMSFTFSEKEIIKIKIEKDVKSITLHSKDIDIETVKYKSGKIEQFASKISYDTEAETATFNFKNKINKGTGELQIVFSGIISDSLRGFYRSKHTIDGQDKYIATTQFESTDARRAFPCFDEPAQKAVFELSIVVPDGHTAISNTLPINIAPHSSGYKMISFAPSPKMSTYLLAFIVGEFEYIEGKTKNNIQVRIFTTGRKKYQAKFALEVAIKSLEFYEEYFGIKYPMMNLDLISIPDFEAAGMENWGAITFRESSLLIDEKHSSLVNRQWVATTIAHELAHQWFGNLVTMHWWTDLWLNEGFASYMEKVCTNYLFPEWKVWNLFLSNNRIRNAFEIDSLVNSHPIEVEVNHPDEINETFDMVSYEKGTAIIRMLKEYIGENNFRNGLKYYLTKHSYKNTRTIDLWDAFEKVSHKPIRKIIGSWTSQAGFPLISVSYDKSGNLKIEQERFFSSRISRKNNKKLNLWQIPVAYEISGKTKFDLASKKKTILKQNEISKINTNEVCFMKVKYSKSMLDKLKSQIIDGNIDIIERFGIAKDIFSLNEGGYIKTSEAMGFSLAYKNEKEFIVWSEIASGINKIANIVDIKSKEKFSRYVLSLFSPIAIENGFNKKDNENDSNTLLRILSLSMASYYGDKIIIKEAKDIFKNRNEKFIDPNIRDIVYNTVTRYGGKKEWILFKDMYMKEPLQEEKERILRAMTKFKSETLINKTLNFLISKNVRVQDSPYMIASSWINTDARDTTWKFIRTNWDEIIKRYGGNGLLLSKLMYILGNHTKPEDLTIAKKFFKTHPAPGAERTLLQAYERIESNIAWIKDDKKDIENWLDKNF